MKADRYRPNANDESLAPWLKISDLWPQQPPDGRLHIFVDVSDVVDVLASSGEYSISLSLPIPTCRFSTYSCMVTMSFLQLKKCHELTQVELNSQ